MALMYIDYFFLMGITGMLLILVAFFMVQGHRWSQDGLRYDVMNLLGSVLLVAYGVAGRAWPFVILNGIWALYSLKDVIQDIITSSKK